MSSGWVFTFLKVHYLIALINHRYWLDMNEKNKQGSWMKTRLSMKQTNGISFWSLSIAINWFLVAFVHVFSSPSLVTVCWYQNWPRRQTRCHEGVHHAGTSVRVSIYRVMSFVNLFWWQNVMLPLLWVDISRWRRLVLIQFWDSWFRTILSPERDFSIIWRQ